MTTTQPNFSPTSDNRDPIKPPPRAKRLLLFNSIGTRLFVWVMGGALIGLGSLSFFFYQEMEKQAIAQISNSLNTEVNAIDGKLAVVNQAARDMAGSIKFLHAQKVQDAEVYKALALEFFLKRPKLAMGAGFGQTSKAIVPDRQWYYPYFYADQKAPAQVGKRLPSPNDQVFYAELFKEDKYPTQDYYKIPVKTKKEVWTEPYLWYGITMSSFVFPIFDDQHQIIGVADMDVNVTNLSQELKSSVIRHQGYFALISEQGKLLSYSPLPALATARESYQKVPELKAVWSKLQQQSGLFRGEGKFWAYQRLSNTNWLILAVVPESVVLGPVLTITVAGTLAASVLLAVVVLLFVRFLNRRLRPILDECNKLAQTDAETEARLEKLDEIGRLSTSFYNLLEQIAANEEQIRQEAAARLVETQSRLKQATEAQQEGEALQAEVGQILDVVLAVETGDLTVQAHVSDRSTGLVADTLNRLIEELARIMSAVLSTAQQVNSGAADLEHLAVSAAQQAQQQALSVNEVQASIVYFNELSQETAQQAVVSDEAVQQAQSAVTQGESEMATMTQEISFLQQGTEQIVQRTQLLTNFVASASQFAKDQKQVAALTRVLALNASMIAARASGQEDPEQFASVAREFETVATQVNDLAIQTNQSLLLLQQRTDQIQTVVSGISQDVQEISSSVNSFIQSVDRSGQVFNNIKTVTNRVAQVGQQVTQSSQAIATTANSTLRSIQDIATVAFQAEEQSRFTREQAGLMDRLARTLLERVRFFRLSVEAKGSISTSPTLPSDR